MTIGLPKGYRQPSFKHSVGVSLVVPDIKTFSPLPTMSPREIAYHRGRDLARRGRKADENPYGEQQAELSAEFMRGFDEGR